ncbi:uncharacterized protein LOC113795615 isoform X3 [Dermatophagoides pteronyssinus]|uniref:uncharacterized protein LOC113795615 isoform X3 n=1 Tax=Dermatophagoides pteronyssinus TaxID=6956 RepID=UPI003F670299
MDFFSVFFPLRLSEKEDVNSSQALLRNRIKLQQQNLARSYLYHSSSLDLEPSTTSFDHQHRSTPPPSTISTQSSPPPPPTILPRNPKRVHYANQPITFSKSLTTSAANCESPTLSSITTTTTATATTTTTGTTTTTIKPLRPAILPRQTSTTTPIIQTKPIQIQTTTTTTTNLAGKFSNGSNATSTATTTTNSTAINGQQQQSISLPRGGEEVLINGGGHYHHHHGRSRSYQKPSATRNHHYGKHLFTSSSIDVAVTSESGIKTENQSINRTAAIDLNSSRNKNNNVATSKSSSSAAAATNVDKNPQESSTESKQNKMVSNANNNNNNSNNQQQQQQQNRQQTSSSQQSNRSQSTTPLDRNYFHHFQTKNPTNSCLFDDDPGIMSEIETSATGFNRRQTNKIRSSLPIVRTPSKSLDRSMGLVFLQFRNETKRALLPNEITSIDTVKALFVRSFPRQLSMEYLDHPSVRIYIHDPNKNMFYELEDLHDVKDRCILRIYEQSINGPQPGGGIIHQSLMAAAAAAAAAQSGQFTTGGPVNVGGGHHHDGDGNYGYFSEPEFDSEYQSQHIHQRKRFPSPIVGHQSLMIGQQQTAANANATNIPPQSQYYGTIMLPPQYRSATLGPLPPRSSFFINQNITGVVQPPIPPTRNKQFANFSHTLPRGTHLINPNPVSAAMNPFAQPPPPKPQRNFPNNSVPQSGGDIIMIQGHQLARSNGQAAISSSNESSQQQPYNRPLPDRPYSVAGHYPNLDRTNPIVGTTRFQFQPTTATNQQISGEFSGYLSSPEHHQHHRQTIPTNATLINIGQLRASFAAGGPPGHPPPPGGYPSTRLFDPNNLAGISTTAVVGNPNTFIARQQQQAASSSTSNVIDDEARIRMQEMERKIASLTNVVSKALTTGPKPPPPPKPSALVNYRTNEMNSSISIDNNNNNLQQLRQIRRKARDLRQEIRQLKRFTVQQMNNAREQMKENCLKIQQTLSLLTKPIDAPIRLERIKISINCDSYNDDAIRLDRDLLELEAQVESLRSNVINRRCRVNMSNVESMALILSRASKTVADLKSRYPLLAQNLKTIMSKELHEIEKEEKFLKEEPERLEHSLKRCKKLTGTLVTLKRLASVQEQRSSNNNTSSPSSQLLQTSSSLDKKDGSIDENLPLSSSGGGGGGRDLSSSSTTTTTTLATTTTTTTTRTKKIQAWHRSAHFHRPILCSHNYKIDLYRGFASMPTIEEPNSENSIDADDEYDDDNKSSNYNNNNKKNNNNKADNNNKNSDNKTFKNKSFDADLMEPHTIIQVIPATPSSTDSTKTTASNMLDNLLDELQTFSKQSSIDLSSSSLSNRSSPFQRTGSFRSIKSSSINNNNDDLDSDTIVRKASRSKSYSSIRATSEPPGVRSRISSIPDGRIDLDNIALLATNCGNAAAATAALLEKRFAQSRQELLEQRHQELLYKQKQLQEQYTRLQQLSKRPISSQRSGGGSGSDNNSFLNDLKKTGSENNIVSKSANLTNNNDVLMINNNNSSSTMNKMINNSNSNTIMINPTVHGSLHNINGTNNNNRNINEPTENGNIIISEMTTNTTTQVRKTFETEIL